MEEVVNNSVKKLEKTMWIKFIILILINKLLKSMIFPLSFTKLYDEFYTKKEWR